MANDKTYDRHINIWINGKEVKNDLSSMEKELYKLRNEWKKTTVGTQEWIDKGKEIKKLKGIVDEHNASLRKTPGFLDKIKGSWGLVMGALGAAYGIFQSFKSIIESTDESSDKFAKTMGGIKEAINAVSQAMASNNFKNFFKNIKDAVEEGQRYVDAQDAMGDSARALALEEERVADRIIALRIIQADMTKSREEQIRAGEEIERVQAELADKRARQAQTNLDNELENARFRSKLDDATIKSFLRQDEAMAKNMETGKKFFDLVTEFNTLSTAQMLLRGKAIKQELDALGTEAPRYAAIYRGMSLVNEDHRDRIIAAEREVSQAKRSATEDILRTITRLNTARAAEANEANKNAVKELTAVQAQREAARIFDEIMKRAADQEKTLVYNPDEAFSKEDKAKLDAEKKLNEERLKDTEQTEKKKVEALIRAGEEGTEAAKKEWAERKALEQAALDTHIEIYRDYAVMIGDALGEAIANGDNFMKAAAKQMLLFAIDQLATMARIYEKEAFISSIAKYGIIAGTIRAGAITLLIETALGAARHLINKNMWTGGFTGSGGKYEPAGIVHKGEWVANADMVASPQYGPIIRALETAQHPGSTQGYADGGVVNNSGSSAAQASIAATDPELKLILRQIGGFLYKLDLEGVSARFGYRDIDSIRKGMDRLNEIEGDVTRS